MDPSNYETFPPCSIANWYKSLYNFEILLLKALLIILAIWILMHFQEVPYLKDPDSPVKIWRIRNLDLHMKRFLTSQENTIINTFPANFYLNIKQL